MNLIYILLLSIIGYYSQGIIYPEGSIISQLLLLVILSISLYSFLKLQILKINKSLFYIFWTILFLLNVFGFFFTAEFSDPKHFGMFKGIILNFLIFYPIYFYTLNKRIQSKHLVLFIILLSPIFILQYFQNYNSIVSNRISDNENVVNNYAYNLVWIIPFLFFMKRKILSIVIIFPLIFLIIQGAKRGAVIIGLFATMLFFINNFKSIIKEHKFKAFFVIPILLIVVLKFIIDNISNNDFLLSRIEKISEGGSGRDNIFKTLYEVWSTSESYINFIFGYGFASSRDFVGTYAHNDWLELLINFGLVGFIIYLMLFIIGFRSIFTRGISQLNKNLLVTVMGMWFLVSLFSMGYTNLQSGFMRSILLGYIFAQLSSQQKNKIV